MSRTEGLKLGPGMVPRGLEPRTLRLLAVRSNQLSYETLHKKQKLLICRFDTPESN